MNVHGAQVPRDGLDCCEVVGGAMLQQSLWDFGREVTGCDEAVRVRRSMCTQLPGDAASVEQRKMTWQ